MNAGQAKKMSDDWMKKATRDHAKEYKEIKAREKRESDAVWKERGAALVDQLEGFIRKAATKGKHHIWEPSRNNPNGDDIFYLLKEDMPIYHRLMDHFRNNGFTVQEYQYGGMKITW